MICFLTGPWVIVPPGEHPSKIVPHRLLINTVKIVQQLQHWSPMKGNKTNKPQITVILATMNIGLATVLEKERRKLT